MSWSTFLENAPPDGHAVQVYADLGELAPSVGRFLDAGFRAGEPAIVIARPEHWEAFRAEITVTAFPLFSHPDEVVGAMSIFWELPTAS